MNTILGGNKDNSGFSVSPGRPIQVRWPTPTIPAEVYRALKDKFWSANTYGHLQPAEMHAVIAEVSAAAAAKQRLSLDAAFSIHHLTIKAKIMSGYHRMNRDIAKITKQYDRGVDILVLSARYDFPPLNLLRGILLHRGRGNLSPTDIYEIFAEKQPPTKLSGRDLAQFLVAHANDAGSVIDQQAVATKAQSNEDIFIKWVQSWPCQPALRTQDDLAAEQIAEFGRAIITPDLLFDEPVTVNGRPVHWIDFKSYVGCDIQFIAKSNKRQAQRYTDKWGPGALCFQLGVVEGAKVSLDGGAVAPLMLSCDGLNIGFDNSLFR